MSEHKFKTKEEKNGITRELLYSKFQYSNGTLIYKSRCGARKSGDEAGYTKQSGYKSIKINRVNYLLHRLIFIYHYGAAPAEIDHIDGDHTNNRIENLQPITHQDNIRKSKMYSSNKSGAVGVSLANGYNDRWVATLRLDGKAIHLGTFHNFKEAVRSRKLAESKYYKQVRKA